LRHGDARTFHPGGTRRTEGKYSNGEQVGVWRSFRADGSPLEELHFAGGAKDGPTTRWQVSGVKEIEGSYKADKKDGTFNYFDADGELQKTEEYKAGRLLRTKRHSKKDASRKVALGG
jgi:antitoxin component YwqK of YwqJK toxin-antitoxin module